MKIFVFGLDIIQDESNFFYFTFFFSPAFYKL